MIQEAMTIADQRTPEWVMTMGLGSARELPQRRPLVHSDMIGLVALDIVLGVVLAGVNRVTLKCEFGRDDSGDAAADTPGFRVPAHVISALETPLYHGIAPVGSRVCGS